MMFCAGMYAMLSQVLLLRELLVAFYGNELTIGAMLSVWLVVIGAGSLAVLPLLRRVPTTVLPWGLVVLLVILAGVLPAQVWLIRVIRSVIHVPYGEYVPFLSMLVSTTLILLPACLSIGIIFPCACHLAGIQDSRAVGRLYAVESLGSLIGGALFTFVFVLWLTPLATLVIASLVALVGAAIIAPRAGVRRCLLLPILVLAVAGVCPRCLSGLEWASIEARWRAFGCLPASMPQLPASRAAAPEENTARLVASVDSRYQNLALIEAQEQMTLYGNGQVLAVFPDPIGGEHNINFIMAQNPTAASVLLIGGNPVNDIPELLKYPLRRLVHVELDGDIGRLLDRVGGPEYWKAVADPRYVEAEVDGPRFVKASRDLFDIVIVAAPEPTTIALNRFYTLDFYQAVKRRLSAGGFLYTAIEASENLQEEAAGLTASICQSLQGVFSRVLVTGGTRNQIFAGMDDSPLTFDRQVLFQRSAGAGLRHRYFRPEYFLNADEISPDKTEFVKKRLAGIKVSANTALRPISTFYHLMLWSRFSGSQLEGLLAGLGRVHYNKGWTIIGTAGAIVVFISLCLGLGLYRRRNGAEPCLNVRCQWAQGMLGLVIATTGFCGMAMELALIFMFQSLLGYIYARIGLIVAVFMLGLMLGALSFTKPSRSSRVVWSAVVGLDVLLLVMALAVPPFMTRFSHSPLLAGSGILVEGFIDSLILLTGWAVGAQFVGINHLLRETGMPLGAAAASANAADLFGAALGGLVIGVVWLPLGGIQASCFLLAAIKGASLLAGISARGAIGRGDKRFFG